MFANLTQNVERALLPAASGEPVAAIDQLSVSHPCLCRHFVRPHWPGIINVKNLMPMGDQVIRYQHSVAMKVHPLRAHISRPRLLGQLQQFSRRALKLWAQHVIGVIAEARVAKSDIRRVVPALFAISTECLHPDIPDALRGKRILQALAIEMRQAPRHGKGTDIGQGLNRVCLQDLHQFPEIAGGVADSEKSCQAELRFMRDDLRFAAALQQ